MTIEGPIKNSGLQFDGEKYHVVGENSAKQTGKSAAHKLISVLSAFGNAFLNVISTIFSAVVFGKTKTAEEFQPKEAQQAMATKPIFRILPRLQHGLIDIKALLVDEGIQQILKDEGAPKTLSEIQNLSGLILSNNDVLLTHFKEQFGSIDTEDLLDSINAQLLIEKLKQNDQLS